MIIFMTERYPNPDETPESDTEPARLLEGEPVDPREDPEVWDAIHNVNDAFGTCNFPEYCKFYGHNPGFCDRICAEEVWDQI
jgi:hypothetical protein